MQFCTACGARRVAPEQFCQECGQRFQGAVQTRSGSHDGQPLWSKPLFLASLLPLFCFFAPWFTLTMANVQGGPDILSSFSGYDLTSGGPTIDGQRLPGASFLVLVFLIAILLSVVAVSTIARKRALTRAIALAGVGGALGAVAILLLFYKSAAQSMQPLLGAALTMSMKYGYIFSLLGFLAAGAGAVGQLLTPPSASAPSIASPNAADSARQRCPHCGANTRSVDRFCVTCGRALREPGSAT